MTKKMTATYHATLKLRVGLHESRVEICHVFTSGGLESSAKNSTSHFFTHMYLKNLKRILQSI